MFMPAGGDEANVKMGGLGKTVLGDGVEIIEFPDMAHGWTVRGDLVSHGQPIGPIKSQTSHSEVT
jgi:hypothetical protein